MRRAAVLLAVLWCGCDRSDAFLREWASDVLERAHVEPLQPRPSATSALIVCVPGRTPKVTIEEAGSEARLLVYCIPVGEDAR